MIAGYAEVGGRVLPIVVVEHSDGVHVHVCRVRARHHGIAFGDAFIAGSLEQLGAQVARNLADAHRPEAIG